MEFYLHFSVLFPGIKKIASPYRKINQVKIVKFLRVFS